MHIVSLLTQEREKIDTAIRILEDEKQPKLGRPPRKRPPMSEAAKAAISKAQRRRWKERRA